MTDERPSRRNDVTDAEVSKTYREIATERTPASLNERVLRAANARTGHGYSRTISWLRPMAWAATIGLCLAIVIELSDVSQLGEPLPERRSIEPAASPEESAVKAKESPVGLAAPAADGRIDIGSEDKRERNLPAAAALENAGRDEAAAALESAGDDGSAATPAPETRRDSPRRNADTRGFEISDAPILEEAEELARMRQGPNQEADLAATSLATRSALPDAAVPARCDDDVRASPESWFECIEELEEGGFDTAAEQELTELKAAFPEFKIP